MSEQVTGHFTREELTCRCGCGLMGFSAEFLEALEELRQAYGRPMAITSGYRCPKHNQTVSSTGESGPHTIGAVDVAVSGPDAHHLLLMALELGWTGIGIKQHGASRFIHLDRLTSRTHPRPRVWSY